MSKSESLGRESEVAVGGNVIRYRERGEGRPIVFIHGLLVNGDLWRKVVPLMAERGYRCITPDLPLGAHELPLADPSKATVGGVAELIAGFLEALDLEDVVLIGNDTGGALCQLVITRHPDRIGTLVLTTCDAFEHFPPKILIPFFWIAHYPKTMAAIFQPLRLAPLRRAPFAFGWLSKTATEKHISDGWVLNLLENEGARRDACSVTTDVSSRYTLDAAKRFGEFTKPVHIVWSSEDKFFPPSDAQRLADLFPDATVEMIDDSYTFLMEDQPEKLAESITSFLSSRAELRAVG